MDRALMHTFQDDKHSWNNGRGRDEVNLQIVPVQEGAENKCLEITARHDRGRMTALASQEAIDLEKFPHVSFDCAIPKDVGVNMQVQVNGAWYEVKLTAPKGAYTVMDDAGVKADGSWHSVSVNLLALAQKTRPDAAKHTLKALMFSDRARTTQKKNASWRIDNLAVSAWGAKQGRFEFSAPDVTGIKGYSVAVDKKRDTEPVPNITQTGDRMRHTFDKPGTWYVHVRAVDNNGNWSATRHMAYATGPEEQNPAPDDAE
jgi:hypothetical protein